jgi:hypothetical protein
VSITIEVTGNSIPEVADKLLAIGASLRSTATEGWSAPKHSVVGAQVAEDKAARVMVTKSNSAKAEVAEAAPVDPTSSTSATAADVLSSQPTTKEPSTTPAPAPSASEDDVPDFDTVVTPLVLKLVEVKGKPAAQEVLGRFGVVKASQLASERWQELVNAINDELAA